MSLLRLFFEENEAVWPMSLGRLVYCVGRQSGEPLSLTLEEIESPYSQHPILGWGPECFCFSEKITSAVPSLKI